MVYGDTRGNSTSDPINTTVLTELARATTNAKPAFVLVPGDLVYSGNLSAFQSWTNLMSPVYAGSIPVYPILGNHDTADINAYLQVFSGSVPANGPAGEIGRTYAVGCSNVLVLALDHYANLNRVNQGWIDSVLATNTLPHVFAMGHAPAFKVHHGDCLDDYPTNRNTFWQSLSNAHSRVYFAGHDHFYDHMRLDDGDGNPTNDRHQFIVGTGGAPLAADGAYDGNNGPWTPVRVLHEEQYGYVLVAIEGRQVTATWYHRVGPDNYAVADTFTYVVPVVTPTLAHDFSEGVLTLTWSNGVLQAAPAVPDSYLDISGAVSPLVITNFAESPQFFRVRAY